MFLIFAIPRAAQYVKRQKLALKKLNSQSVIKKQILSGVAVSQAFCPICNSHVISVKGHPATEDGSDRSPVLVIFLLMPYMTSWKPNPVFSAEMGPC